MLVGRVHDVEKVPPASTEVEQKLNAPSWMTFRKPMVTESGGLSTGQPLPVTVTVLPDAAVWVLPAETMVTLALNTVKPMLALLAGVALSVTVIVVGPGAKPLGTLKVRPLNWPREPVAGGDAGAGAPPTVTAGAAAAAEPPPPPPAGW